MWSSRYGKMRRHTCTKYFAKSKIEPKRVNKSYNHDREVHVCGYVVDGVGSKRIRCSMILSLPSYILGMANFFFMDLHVPHFFFLQFFPILGPSCVHLYFFDSPCLSFFYKNWRERPTHIVEHLFCGMSGWYNANFSKKHSKGVYGVHVNLDHESMKRILSRVTTI